MQAILEVTNIVEDADQMLEQNDAQIATRPGDQVHPLAPVELAYVGGGTGLIAIF
jgi:hypothetical protein